MTWRIVFKVPHLNPSAHQLEKTELHIIVSLGEKYFQVQEHFHMYFSLPTIEVLTALRPLRDALKTFW